LDEPATGLDEFARKIKNPPGSVALGGFRVARIEWLPLRLAYTHAHALQQQQQEMEFVLGVIVMANLFFVQRKL
jgi:hypothetical protein